MIVSHLSKELCKVGLRGKPIGIEPSWLRVFLVEKSLDLLVNFVSWYIWNQLYVAWIGLGGNRYFILDQQECIFCRKVARKSLVLPFPPSPKEGACGGPKSGSCIYSRGSRARYWPAELRRWTFLNFFFWKKFNFYIFFIKITPISMWITAPPFLFKWRVEEHTYWLKNYTNTLLAFV